MASDLMVRSATIDAGLVGGDLAGSLWEELHPAADLASGQWALQAEAVEGVVERRDRPVTFSAGPWEVPVLRAEHPPGTPVQYTSWNATVGALGEDARILVLPAGGAPSAVRMEAAADVGDGPDDVVEHPRKASGQPHFVEDAVGALVVRPAGPALATITGDFVVMVSGMRLEFTADQGDGSLDTRQRVEPHEPSGAVYRSSAFEAVLELRGATVTLPTARLHLRQAALATESTMILAGAKGTLELREGSFVVDGQSVALHGKTEAVLVQSDATDDGLRAVLSGRHVSSMDVDGQAVPLSDSGMAAPGLAAPPWVWPAAGLALAGAYLLAGRQVFHAIDDALAHRRYGHALALTRWLRLHPWLRQDADLAAAISLTELGCASEARERLMGRRWAAKRQATRDFLLARVAVRLGDRAEAVRRLAASLLAEPALRAQVVADPSLAALAGTSPDTLGREAYA